MTLISIHWVPTMCWADKPHAWEASFYLTQWPTEADRIYFLHLWMKKWKSMFAGQGQPLWAGLPLTHLPSFQELTLTRALPRAPAAPGQACPVVVHSHSCVRMKHTLCSCWREKILAAFCRCPVSSQMFSYTVWADSLGREMPSLPKEKRLAQITEISHPHSI